LVSYQNNNFLGGVYCIIIKMPIQSRRNLLVLVSNKFLYLTILSIFQITYT